ncbi:MAG: aspartyl/asparaginyl beta-hydroxylase domain-containing protein [Ahniella sp.]|nr:aspartyl/asparaginyl beta-hydroxylase domain-containing protein [Ahniella sp.]
MTLQHHLVEADRAARQGQFAAAAKHFEAVLVLAPDNSFAHNFFGQMALQRQALEEAGQHFERACQGQPASALAFANLARVLKLKGQLRPALDALNRAVKLDPMAFAAYLEQADIYEALGEIRNAALSSSQALAILPEQVARLPEFQGRLQYAKNLVMADRRQLADVLLARVNPIKSGFSAKVTRRIDETLAIALGQTRYFPSKPLMFHVTRLPSIPFFEREDFAWSAGVEAATGVIRTELEGLLATHGGGFEPYVQTRESESPGQFATLDGNLDWSAFFLWKHGLRVEEHCAACPQTLAALAQVPQITIRDRAPAVMFSALKPRTHIPPHNGATNARLTFHLPLIIPPDCSFRVGAEVRQWKEGELFIFDDTIEHEAFNNSDQLRVVLIFDIWHPMLTEMERQVVRATQEGMMDYYGPDAPIGELGRPVHPDACPIASKQLPHYRNRQPAVFNRRKLVLRTLALDETKKC